MTQSDSVTTAATDAPSRSRRRHLFSSDEYLQIAEAGIFDENDHVELVEGEVLLMSPSSPRHASTINRLIRLLAPLLDRVELSVQNTMRLSETTVVDPDVQLLRQADDGYSDAHPEPSDVLLLIEVAESSLQYDRVTKASLYAAAGIADYWIVNLVDGVVHVHRDPAENGYRSLETHRPDAVVSPLVFPDFTVELSQLLK